MNGLNEIRNEKELIQRIKDGDKEAFSTLFRCYYSDLCMFIHRYIELPTNCESLIQDIFLNIWLKRSQWQPSGTIKSYLCKAARNRAFNYLRHQKIERSFLEQHKYENESEWDLHVQQQYYHDFDNEKEGQEELIAEVKKAVNKLPERMRLIFNLNRDDGLSYPEIAEVLDISVKTVETQMGRALKSIRNQMTDHFCIDSSKLNKNN